MDARLDEILRLLSAKSREALLLVVQLHVRAATTRGYSPSTPEESKRIGALLQEIPSNDLGILVFRLAALDPHLRDFFVPEGDVRQGKILAWTFRGILPNHTPDIVTISHAEPEPLRP